MPFSLELPMNTPDWTDVGSGVRESYCPISAFPDALGLLERRDFRSQIESGGRLDVGVTKELADHRDVDSRFQGVGGPTVAEILHRHVGQRLLFAP